MKIELMEIPIRDLFSGYENNGDEGVVGYGGNLNIRPPYQREFIYEDKEKKSVINTVMNGFPLNVMYWNIAKKAKKIENGKYEVIDGQQRILSICQFLNNEFSISYRNDDFIFDVLTDDEKEKIENYKLMVYFCEGTDREKLDWFEIINIAGKELTRQELRNAVYSCPWVTAAKKKFSRNNCAAYRIARDYLKGSAIRQDYLETAIKWHSDGDIRGYMNQRLLERNDNADDLWDFFKKVIDWVEDTFPETRNSVHREHMEGVPWGPLYKRYGRRPLDPDMDAKVFELMANDEITRKSGIFSYVFNPDDERPLSIRTFTKNQKTTVVAQQENKCGHCERELNDDCEAHHKDPWNEGGRTILENCIVLCRECHQKAHR